MAEYGASIAGLLSLTITVVDISHRYFSGAKNATRTIKGYFRELEALKLLLGDLSALDAGGLSDAATTINALEGCHTELNRLRSKLQKRTSDNAFSHAVHRLTWPFAEEETRSLIQVIHRYIDVFHAAFSVQHAKLSAATLQAVERVEKRTIDVERRRLLGWLSSVNPYSNHTAARDKRGVCTGQWFINSQEFVRWERESQTSLWLTGIPGAGKTVLCSTVIDHLQHSQKVNEAVAIFYFDFSDDQKQTLESLLHSFLRQLCEVLDIPPPELVDLFESSHGRSRPLSVDRNTLVDLLKTVCKSFESITLVLDALDECSEASSVLGFLHDLMGYESQSLKWLVTSRRKQEIEDSLLSIGATVVPLDNGLIDADIRLHVSECLANDPKLSSRPAGIKRQIEDVLTEKARGMFRWVDCQLDVIRRCRTAPAIGAALCTLPETLDATYERILLSIDDDDREHASKALELLAFAKRPLRVEEVAEAVVIPPGCRAFDVDDRFFDPKDIVALCAGLIKRVQDTNELVLSHYSVQEYLLSTRILHSVASYFALDRHLAHARLAEACLTYLLSLDGHFAVYHGLEDDFPFLQYAAQYWLDHVPTHTTDSPSVLTSLVFSLLRRWQEGGSFDWSIYLFPDHLYDYHRYIQQVYPDTVQEKPSPVALMCFFDRFDVALSCLESEGPLHTHGLDCAIVLKAAVKLSSSAILDRVITAGCHLNVALPEGSNALCLAASKGDLEMIQKLLVSGADVSRFAPDATQSPQGAETALHAAVKGQSLEAVRVLLTAGADINALEAHGGSLLSALLRSEKFSMPDSMELVKLLIHSGANVNVCGIAGLTPLNTFLSRLYPPTEIPPAIVQILLDCHVDAQGLSGEYGILLFNLASTIARKRLNGLDLGAAGCAPFGSAKTQILHTRAISTRHATAIVKVLLSAGADPNALGGLFPATVRSIAWKYRLFSACHLLLKAGADLDLLGPDRGTVLQAACSLPFQATELVLALLDSGADPNCFECAGDAPLSMAAERGYHDTVKALKEAGARSLPKAATKANRETRYSRTCLMKYAGIDDNPCVKGEDEAEKDPDKSR